MLDKDKIVVGSRFVVEKSMSVCVYVSSLGSRKLVPHTVLRVVKVYPFPLFSVNCVHTVEGEKGEFVSVWLFEDLCRCCREGILRFVDPACDEIQLSGSEPESKTTNDANETCYFCGKPTEPLMGQSRYCPKCQK